MLDVCRRFHPNDAKGREREGGGREREREREIEEGKREHWQFFK